VSGGLLLDVNVLVALAWPTHVGHPHVQKWFARHGRETWATCPVTQSGFIRILSNPSFAPNALSPAEAIRLLEEIVARPGHRFWPFEIGVVQAIRQFLPRIQGYRQISDAYLLGLALHHRGKLVTLDQGVPSLLPEKSSERGHVVVIEQP